MFPPGEQLQYQGIEESGTPLGIWRLVKKPEVNGHLSSRMVTTLVPLMQLPSRREIEAQLAKATERYAIASAWNAVSAAPGVGG